MKQSGPSPAATGGLVTAQRSLLTAGFRALSHPGGFGLLLFRAVLAALYITLIA